MKYVFFRRRRSFIETRMLVWHEIAVCCVNKDLVPI